MKKFTEKDAERIRRMFRTWQPFQFEETEAHVKLMGLEPPKITLGEPEFMGLYDDEGNLITADEEEAKKIMEESQ